ncbi:hypothetical protein SAMN05892883_2575 [Jatrophihabitans sp. GAS493]|uniref:hypothetical protein n=1 Tax=Jatrophihabitans sp. GAS493 TaxID=1907575 RepID=UPI000BB7B9EA|nr:hypothetical protein [Jatrophihabitans sp. GAS493]SOD73284.1 hypothetical protein SAMN05892883_2575 [Jatrophihabitans sp. GAS493]
MTTTTGTRPLHASVVGDDEAVALRLRCELPTDDHVGDPALRVLVPVALSRQELVTAFYIGIDPGDNPTALTGHEVEESLLVAVLGRGVWEIQDEARDLATTIPRDLDAARFLRGCQLLADQYLTRVTTGNHPWHTR